MHKTLLLPIYSHVNLYMTLKENITDFFRFDIAQANN